MRRRRITVIVGAIIGLGVLFAAWAGWRAYQVNQSLNAAIDDASRLQRAVLNDDQSGQDAALADLQDDSARADELTGGPTWSVLSVLPVVGDDADGVRTVSSVAADLADHGIEPLLDTTGSLDKLLPKDGRIDVAAMEELQGPLAEGADAFARADAELAERDPSAYVGRLRDKYRDFAVRVEDAHRILSAADTAVQVMPSMLGAGGTQHFLLVFQNNAEIRSTGGLPGAVSLVTASDGKVEMTKQVAGNSFGERATPVLDLTDAERQIYGDQVGTYFLDANFTPDFSRTADLMRARWEEVEGGRLDGVISIDPVALSYILGATGPVQAGTTELTQDNVVDQLLHQVYLDHPNPLAQDAFFRQVARAVFDKVSQGAESPIDLAEALGHATREHRIYVHSFQKSVQSSLADTAVAGQLTDPDATGPQVGVYLNDGTGSKMSYYLRYQVGVDATYCSGGVQGLMGSARLTSTAPKDAASLPHYITGGGRFGTEPGHQQLFVRLYAPVGGSVSAVEINRRPVDDVTAIPQDDRLVVTVPVELAPGETVDLTWQMRSGAEQTGAVRVSVTPGIAPRDTSSTAPSACAS
ncbi:DUF4012 domain-containing protein [Nocardioides mangrovi]|uniref:DUF4012 domain-containing protein n=1 Tax=Nocardioides mangrovi TaxID=2874580 RepID=A0ABS7UCR3_9ACTN|nr:DUF4012 domain-containing protein [Nocardioides mangrovi]MBZ5738486.1 DUF4012 domain-containing protein [Nocardioides mangrovi]